MAKNRTSAFGATDNLDFGVSVVAQHTQDVQEVQEDIKKEYGSTQGNKSGAKLKRINMAFSDNNYEFITKESRRQGMSATAFVNKLLDQYRAKG
jgi:predicted DNA binding CopG/RHH family protein